MRNRSICLALAIAAALTAASSTSAGVSLYKYDALGRLVRTCSAASGSPGRGDKATYTFDNADNRQAYSSSNTAFDIPMGSSIYSADGRFFLAMQSDANLVIYGPAGALWSTSTVGSGASRASFQSDGNFVLYTPTDGVPWNSGTAGNGCASLVLQNDGNLVISSTDGVPLWASNTGGH